MKGEGVNYLITRAMTKGETKRELISDPDTLFLLLLAKVTKSMGCLESAVVYHYFNMRLDNRQLKFLLQQLSFALSYWRVNIHCIKTYRTHSQCLLATRTQCSR